MNLYFPSTPLRERTLPRLPSSASSPKTRVPLATGCCDSHLIVGLWLLALAATATGQNFTNTPPRLAIERQVEGLGLRVIGDAGVFYEPRVGTESGEWTNLSGHISNDTNEIHWIDGQGTKFFQWVADDRVRFPAWLDFVEKRVTFNFQPSRRGGTFRLETYADGMFWGSAQGNVDDWADSTGTVRLRDDGDTSCRRF